MKIIFLGTNGWYDTKIGNTPCVLLDTKDNYIIFDAGYGIASARDYIKDDKPTYLFISHFHMDHVCGLHALATLTLKQPLTIIGNKDAKRMIKVLVRPPFMDKLEHVSFGAKVFSLKEGEYTTPIKFTCLKLNHIVLTLGYRLYV